MLSWNQKDVVFFFFLKKLGKFYCGLVRLDPLVCPACTRNSDQLIAKGPSDLEPTTIP